MIMRYPIEKSLKSNKGREVRFDFVDFGEKSNKLCEALRRIDYDISNQMREEASEEELNAFLDIVEIYRVQIDEFVLLLKSEMDNPKVEENHVCDFWTLLGDENSSSSRLFLKKCHSDLLILLDTLFYAGRSINDHCVRLSQSPEKRKREFVRLCDDNMRHERLYFGQNPSVEQINIQNKVPAAILRALETSLLSLGYMR